MKNKDGAKLILDFAQNIDVYSDGNVEDEILNIFKSENPEGKIEEVLRDNPSWPIRYHLSPIRENLLDWYEFPSGASILEVGAGCGAITGIFSRKVKKVVAVELSRRRAEIVAERHKDKDNLVVYAGNLNDIKLGDKFDYVTSIGVLEYAGKYTHTDNPYLDFILNLKKYLNESGTLVIAIENRFGLKYWSGCREDHTGRFFDSIEGYPNTEGIYTFGKKEISDLLKNAGFNKIEFFYPMPDYKLPVEIFSDEYLPTASHPVSNNEFPFKDFAQDREYLFDERLVLDGIINNGQFDFFANSFLIFASV